MSSYERGLLDGYLKAMLFDFVIEVGKWSILIGFIYFVWW